MPLSVDVVIPVHGQWELTERCLATLAARDACIRRGSSSMTNRPTTARPAARAQRYRAADSRAERGLCARLQCRCTRRGCRCDLLPQQRYARAAGRDRSARCNARSVGRSGDRAEAAARRRHAASCGTRDAGKPDALRAALRLPRRRSPGSANRLRNQSRSAARRCWCCARRSMRSARSKKRSSTVRKTSICA